MPFFGSGGGSAAGIGGSTGATDNAILRADGTGATTVQNSAIAIDDAVVPFSATGVASTDVITAVGHNFTTNQLVRFVTLTGATGNFFVGSSYFVRDISGDTFKLALTSGGSAINFTTDITAATIVAVQNNVVLRNASGETNSSLVLLTKGTAPIIISNTPPDGTAAGGNPRGTESVCIVPSRSEASQVASGNESVAIGRRATASGNGSVAIGNFAFATAGNSVGIGSLNGRGTAASSVGINAIADMRGQFACYPFSSLFWAGATTNATATVLNLDGTATNRFTIAANTAVIANLYIIARRTDTVDKWFSGQRKVAIRRNNANGTAIIGSVETIGADQTEGSPTWSVAITADDTNEALQVEVTGAASETVSWRVMAFYHVV
jgi:hypothetical protein